MSRRSARTLLRTIATTLLALVLAAPAPAQPGASRRERSRAFEQVPPGFRQWLEELPEEQRRPLLRRLGRMPPQRRERVFRRFEAMDAEQRERFESFLAERSQRREEMAREGAPPRRPAELSPESREKLAPLVRRWRAMEPGERRKMRQRLERFGALSAENQEQVVERRFHAKSPEERARILESLREASRALPPRAD